MEDLGKNQLEDELVIPPLDGVLAERWSLGKFRRMLGVFGPAAILASVAVGAGETIVVVRSGAWSQYDLLWLVLLSVIVKGIFVTYLLGRYTAVSGEHIGHRLVHLPGPRGWFLIAMIILEFVSAPLVWVAIAKPCGHLVYYVAQGLFPDSGGQVFWENMITTCFIALALGIGLCLTYGKLEKQQLIICGILVVGTVLGTIMVRPDIRQVLLGLINFGHMPEMPSWAPPEVRKNSLLTLVTMFGYVGGSVMGYIAYAHWVGMRGWGLSGHKDIEAIRRHAASRPRIDYLPEDAAQVKRLRKRLLPLRWDVGMGVIVLLVVSSAFLIAGAAVLFPKLKSGELTGSFHGWNLLTDQRHVWQAIHPYLIWVYYTVILAALWGTLQALPEVYARVSQEFCKAIWPGRRWGFRRMQAIICLYVLVSSATIIWCDISFNTLIYIAGFLTSNLAVTLMMFGALYLNFKLPRVYRTRRVMLVGGIFAAMVLTVITIVSGWGVITKWLG